MTASACLPPPCEVFIVTVSPVVAFQCAAKAKASHPPTHELASRGKNTNRREERAGPCRLV
jgi:hypothetical protein